MRLTIKNQVTVPLRIRKVLGLKPKSEIEFIEEDGKVYIIKKNNIKSEERFKNLKGKLRGKITTQELMDMTRGDD